MRVHWVSMYQQNFQITPMMTILEKVGPQEFGSTLDKEGPEWEGLQCLSWKNLSTYPKLTESGSAL